MKIFTSTDEIDVRKVNRAFYEAIESLDIGRMEEIWMNDDAIECIHPGWTERLSGWRDIMQSWYSIFQNTQYIEFSLADVRVTVDRDLAIVTCTERIVSSVNGELIHNDALATNAFRRYGDRWWMVLHHAS